MTDCDYYMDAARWTELHKQAVVEEVLERRLEFDAFLGTPAVADRTPAHDSKAGLSKQGKRSSGTGFDYGAVGFAALLTLVVCPFENTFSRGLVADRSVEVSKVFRDRHLNYLTLLL